MDRLLSKIIYQPDKTNDPQTQTCKLAKAMAQRLEASGAIMATRVRTPTRSAFFPKCFLLSATQKDPDTDTNTPTHTHTHTQTHTHTHTHTHSNKEKHTHTHTQHTHKTTFHIL